MTWTLKLDDSLVSGDYTIRVVRGQLVAFYKQTLIATSSIGLSKLSTAEAKDFCRRHFWSGRAGE